MTGTTSTSTNLSWSGATDNVGVTGYDVYRGGVLIGSTTTATTFAVTGLTPSTTYAFNVRAKDAKRKYIRKQQYSKCNNPCDRIDLLYFARK
ncbi:fibronectin type III domain-containing protein [Flavobacterium piscinae]|uniref:fibronectin type III domain-containing protein n=1 Tax=Flavobacterium piscinae TaxID=2506424 RepID=UPI0019ADB390|nr:fibronectin type III domain-containing protein [Flavobacterium piscinae]MBC8883786.1 fibronectin type III domain-containing protein [Flavobacterium piscinae]